MRSGIVATLLGVVLGGSIVAAVFAAEPPSPHHPPTDPHLAGTIAGFIDFTPRGTQPGLAFPLLGPSECASCHRNAEAEVHYPAASWSGSMMANATRDPLFWAALDVANQDGSENGAEGIGDYCLRCHTPNGWYNGRVRKVRDVSGSTVEADDIVDGYDGCMLRGDHDNGDIANNDYSGIGCQFCHRNQATGPLGEPSFLENADIWLDDVECDSNGDGFGDGEPCRAGPYDYPLTEPGFEGFEPPHAWAVSDYHADSALCGSCHDVTTPMLESGPFRTLILDDGTNAGNDTGLPYPVERTYSEWQNSDYARLVFRDGIEAVGPIPGKRLATGATCQDCHMRQAQPQPLEPEADLLVCFFGPPRNGNLPVHEFVGGNTWIPQILKGELPGLSRDIAFDQTTAWANELLAERSAVLETTVRTAGANTLAVDVSVFNLAGHKLPTGYAEGRRMWLEVEVRDASDAVLWHNGAWDPATGDLDVDAQTKIYEIKQGIWNAGTGTCDTTDAKGREMFHFVLNNCIAKDNRIPPLGFTAADDPEMAAYGTSYTPERPGSNRSAASDRTSYTVPLPEGANGPFTVHARLQFQLASREYIEFLRNEADENAFPAENDLCADGPGRPFTVGPQDKSRGQYMYDLWSSPAYGRSPPVEMASAQASTAP
ncbi:hypothetical protein [Chiayiivirga flava]|uniref:Cytochrome c-552/4 domain-containing protein n=1 Tax=Chiayiivirga flava TaxID=659595 RepID=A0A7W8D5W2_9GAMM|nr:hypothetical protein [Chiayiivirga flava]MBB5208498.1 hypothetical protein [Chiayiivirga flava]